MSYLEKAYAKLNEGYFNICNNGMAAHALTDLTSAPCRVWQLSAKQSTQSLKDLLTDSSLKKFPMTARSLSFFEVSKNYIETVGKFARLSGEKETDFSIREFGIFPDYEYACLGVATISVDIESLG